MNLLLIVINEKGLKMLPNGILHVCGHKMFYFAILS